DNPRDRGRIGDVELQVLADAACLTDQLVGRDGAFVRVAFPRRDDHGCSFRCESKRNRTTDPRRSADDERHLPGKPALDRHRTAIAAISWRYPSIHSAGIETAVQAGPAPGGKTSAATCIASCHARGSL